MLLVSIRVVNKEIGNRTGNSKPELATKVTNDHIKRYRNEVRLKNWTQNTLTCNIGGFLIMQEKDGNSKLNIYFNCVCLLMLGMTPKKHRRRL